MLELNDTRWSELWTRNGPAGWVPKELAALIENPKDNERFSNLWSALCSEGTAWSASFAATPYVLAIARLLAPQERVEHIFFIGNVQMSRTNGEDNRLRCPAYLTASHDHAVVDALPLALETLQTRPAAEDTRYLLAAIAALLGHVGLANTLNTLDAGCQECGTQMLGES